MTRREKGETERLTMAIERMRATLNNLDIGMKLTEPSLDDAQSVQSAATEIVMSISKLHAFGLVSRGR